MRKIITLLVVLGIFGYEWATTAVTPEKTQLQIQEFQTRWYETNDMKMS